jgi:hypothetical protein
LPDFAAAGKAVASPRRPTRRRPVEEIRCVDNEVIESESGEPPERRGLNRRVALGGLAAGVGTALATVVAGRAAAQTDTTGPESSGPPTTEATTTTAPPQRPTTQDTVLLGFAQSIEYAASDLYDEGIPKLSDDSAQIALTFSRHHQAYAQQIGGLLGRRAPGIANRTLLRERTAAFSASSEDEVLRAMYELEISLAASYSAVLGQLRGTDGAALVASIQPIEARQAVVWGQALGLGDEDLMPVLEGDEPGATLITPAQYPVV